MAIRWKEGERAALYNEIARYNRKIDRLRRQGTELGMGSLPQKITTAEFMKIGNRAELKEYEGRMKRFLTKGSEQLTTTKSGITIPKYEQQEVVAANARINARRAKKWKEAQEAKKKGDLPLMGRIQDNAAKPRKALSKVTPQNYEEYKRVALHEGRAAFPREKAIWYKEQYKKMIHNLFSAEDEQTILDAIENIDPFKFVDVTVHEEEVSMSIGSPPAGGRDNAALRIGENLIRQFPRNFKGKKLTILKDTADEIIKDEIQKRKKKSTLNENPEFDDDFPEDWL